MYVYTSSFGVVILTEAVYSLHRTSPRLSLSLYVYIYIYIHICISYLSLSIYIYIYT